MPLTIDQIDAIANAHGDDEIYEVCRLAKLGVEQESANLSKGNPMKQTYEAKDLAEIAAEFRRRANAESDSVFSGKVRASVWREAAKILEATTLKPEPMYRPLGELEQRKKTA